MNWRKLLGNKEEPFFVEDQPDPPTEPAKVYDQEQDEPSDPHQPPLDNDDDARHLDPADPRRLEVEQRRGRPFTDDEATD
jgi:hypothetical protein